MPRIAVHFKLDGQSVRRACHVGVVQGRNSMRRQEIDAGSEIMGALG